MFEKAARLKLRFNYKGILDVEDLWDLELEELDAMFRKYNHQHKDSEGESLLGKKTADDNTLELQIGIIRHIVGVKLDEARANEELALRREKKHRIMELIAEKQDEALKSKSIDELNALIDNL